MELDSRDSAQRSLLFTGRYQPALTHVLRQHTPIGGYCLDVGANLGFYTLVFAAWAGEDGRVAAFEANPALIERISRSVGLNDYQQVEILWQAVHNEPGEIRFYVAEAAGKSSVLESHVPEPVQALTVEAITIDGYVQSRGWERLDVMKLDIEGNDCKALMGARESLARFRPFVVFEYWYNTSQDISAATFGLLRELGYNLRLLHTDGKQVPFEWREPVSDRRSVDVVAQCNKG